MIPGDRMTDEDRRFVLNDLVQLSQREGLALANQFGGHMPRTGTFNRDERSVGERQEVVFYRCPHLDDDPESPTYRYCLNYENRPPLCKGYPWYQDGPPKPGQNRPALPLDCSFRVDLIEKPS
jgi:Fe-S-cluster containining protein